jgi:hypothetical protein
MSVMPHYVLKANAYSRPISPVMELMPGWGDGLILLPYGNIAPLS